MFIIYWVKTINEPKTAVNLHFLKKSYFYASFPAKQGVYEWQWPWWIKVAIPAKLPPSPPPRI